MTINLPSGLEVIGSDAFSGCARLRDLNLPSTLKYIGNSAFSGCSSLGTGQLTGTYNGTLIIPASVREIGSSAFNGCSNIKTVRFEAGSNCTALRQYVFSNCYSLSTITLPEGLERIESEALNGTNIQSFTIPETVEYVAGFGTSSLTSLTILCDLEQVFVAVADGLNPEYDIISATFRGYRLTNLTTLVVGGANERYSSGDGNNCIIDTDTNTLVLGCKSTIIPSGVTSIGQYAFNGSAPENLFIPASVETIEDNAFYGCYSDDSEGFSITFEEGSHCTSFGTNAFAESQLVSINGEYGVLNIPEGVESIGHWAFGYLSDGDAIKSVILPNSLVSMSDWLFESTQFEDITLPFVGESRVTANSLEQYPFGHFFYYSEYGDWTPPQPYYRVEQDFYLDSLTEATTRTYYIPRSLKSVTLTDSTYLPSGAFMNMNGNIKINLNEGLTTIGDYAFKGYYPSALIGGLLKLPSTVTYIGKQAITSARVLITRATPFEIDSTAFGSGNSKIFVPSGSVEAYRTAWPQYADRIYSSEFSEWDFEIDQDNNAVLTQYYGSARKVVVPSQVAGATVIGISGTL